MKKTLTALVAALALVSVQAPAQAKSRGNAIAAGIAVGVGLGILGAVAASRQSHAHGYRSHGYRDHGYRAVYVERSGNRCVEWRYECRHGSDRACYKYDRHC